MNLLLWILLGVVAGWLASIVVRRKSQQGTLLDIILGVIGAFVGGILVNFFGTTTMTEFSIYGLAVAALGAIALIWLGRVLKTTT